MTCLAFILLPLGLAALYMIVWVIQDKPGCGEALVGVVLALLYPLTVPIASIFLAAKDLFWGKEKGEDLTFMKGLKMFEHLGEYFFFCIL